MYVRVCFWRVVRQESCVVGGKVGRVSRAVRVDLGREMWV